MSPSIAWEDYFPLDIETLRLDGTTNFPLYMKRGSGKPVLYRGKNTQFTGEALDSLRRNDVPFLYVPNECKAEYLEYLKENLADVVDDPDVAVETKCEVAYEAAVGAAEELFTLEPDQEKLAKATKLVFEPMTKVMLDGPEAIKKLVALTRKDYTLYSKAVNMCLLGMLMVRKSLGIAKPKQLMEIGCGFLLCDIAKVHWPDEMLKRDGSLQPGEWEIVKRHPEEALKILEHIRLTDEAKVVIAQHHERIDGSGYPKGLKGDDVHELARIASVADTFSALNSERPFADARKTFDALEIIRNEMLHNLDLELFAQFVHLFSTGDPLAKLRGATEE